MLDQAGITNDLIRHLSHEALVSQPTALQNYGSDFWGKRGIPGAVVRAVCTEDVVETLRYAAGRGIPVVPRAAGTNIGAGFLPTPNSILLDLRGMKRVLGVDMEQREVTVEPGVLNGDLQTWLAPLGFRYVPDPASAAISTIGGNIAENAGGPRCLKYGVTFHHVAGVECVLAQGELLQLGAQEAGPDLLGVLIGSEGTLGIVTQARLKLSQLPKETRTLFATFDQLEAAGAAVSAILATGVLPATIEYLDQKAIHLFNSYGPTGYPADVAAALLIDVDGEPEEVEQHMAVIERTMRSMAREMRRANDESARQALWRGRLLAGQALAASGQRYSICDTTVPRLRIPDMQRALQKIVRQYDLSALMIGHAGDGNVHPVILHDPTDPLALQRAHAAASELISAALELGGTITGEHGIGSEKLPFMQRQFGGAEIAAMRAVKQVFDPNTLLNPGILLPVAASSEPPLPQFTAALQATVTAQKQRATDTGAEDLATSVPHTESRENEIRVDVENLTVCAPADTTLLDVRNRLAQAGYQSRITAQHSDCAEGMSVRDLFSDPSSRVAVRDTLLEIEATLADGYPVRFGSGMIKDVAGYDMKRLFIGSHSLFGTVTQARFLIQKG